MTKNKNMENQITQGKWTVKSDDFDITIIDKFDSMENAVLGGYPEISSSVSNETLAEAICKAVNNTYGKGIDPEKLSYALEEVQDIITAMKDQLENGRETKREAVVAILEHALESIKLEDK